MEVEKDGIRLQDTTGTLAFIVMVFTPRINCQIMAEFNKQKDKKRLLCLVYIPLNELFLCRHGTPSHAN